MSLTEQNKKTAEILSAQGETPERIAEYLRVDVKELGTKKRAAAKPAEPKELEPAITQDVTE